MTVVAEIPAIPVLGSPSGEPRPPYGTAPSGGVAGCYASPAGARWPVVGKVVDLEHVGGNRPFDVVA